VPTGNCSLLSHPVALSSPFIYRTPSAEQNFRVSPEALAAALKVLSSTSHVPPPTPDDSDTIATMGDISSHDLMAALQVMNAPYHQHGNLICGLSIHKLLVYVSPIVSIIIFNIPSQQAIMLHGSKGSEEDTTSSPTHSPTGSVHNNSSSDVTGDVASNSVVTSDVTNN